ncbi:hypothetical protein J32TS6_32260 [Virgibacillus pantothenticus]|nr:hypothetical protein J32TS6_32260 [Virgibacillus pantothenticus]
MVTYILHETVVGCFVLATFLGVALNITMRYTQIDISPFLNLLLLKQNKHLYPIRKVYFKSKMVII